MSATATTFDSILFQDGNKFMVFDSDGSTVWEGEALPPGSYAIDPDSAPELHQRLMDEQLVMIPAPNPRLWPEVIDLEQLEWNFPDPDDYCVHPDRPYNWRIDR